MQPSICVLITQTPYGLVRAAEAVRHVNGALSQALAKQDGPKRWVVVHRPSLADRGLTAADLVDGIELTDDAGLAALIAETQYLLRF